MYDIHILHTARHLYILLREGYALLKCFSLLFVSTTSLGSCNAIIVVCAELKKHDIGHERGTPWQLLHSRSYCFITFILVPVCTSGDRAIIVVEGVEMATCRGIRGMDGMGTACSMKLYRTYM